MSDSPSRDRADTVDKGVELKRVKKTEFAKRQKSHMERHDTFKTPKKLKLDREEILSRVLSVRPDLSRERGGHIVDDVLHKYDNHPRILANIMDDQEKLNRLVKEFCPHNTSKWAFKKFRDKTRHSIREKLTGHGIGEVWDSTILLASFVTVVVYVGETYTDGFDSSAKETYVTVLVWTDFVCTLFFLLDFLLHTVAAVPFWNKTFGGWFSYPAYPFGGGIIDLLTVVPYFVTLAVFGPTSPDIGDSSAKGYIFQEQFINKDTGTIKFGIIIILLLRMLRVIKTLRFTREVRLENCLRTQAGMQTTYAKLTAIIVSMFLGYFCFFASVIYLLEYELEQLQVAIHNQECPSSSYTSYPWATCPSLCVSSSGCQELTWFSSMWMIVVTFTTVGYGDISPVTVLGQAFGMIILIIGVGLIGLKIGDMTTIITTANAYKSPYKTIEEIGHIIITGTITKVSLKALLKEHFHPDHMTPEKFEVEDVVIMNPTAPPPFVMHMLVHGDHALKVSYYEGDVMSQEDLDNVAINQAKHVHLLVNPEAPNHELDDARIMVRATALKSHNPNVTIHAQCHLIVTKRHLEKLMTRGTEQHCPDAVVCLDLLKARMFAQNCLCPGSSTLIANLFASFSGPENAVYKESEAFLDNYFHGCDQELYSKRAPTCLQHRSFEEAADAIFRGHFITKEDGPDDEDEPGGVVLIGVVENPDNVGNEKGTRRRVLINPGKDYLIPSDCKLLLIADDEEVATAVMYATETPRKSKHNKYLAGQMRINLHPDNHPHNTNMEQLERSRDERAARRKSLNRKSMRKAKESAEVIELGNEEVSNEVTSALSKALANGTDADHIKILVEHTKKIDKKLDSLSKMRKARHKMRLHWRHLDAFDEVDTSHHLKFHNHIVICGDNPRLSVFVASVRECLPKHLGQDGTTANIPIVVLSQTDAMHGGRAAWGFGLEEVPEHMIADVYHAQGNPGKSHDLMEVCVTTAACVIIMPTSNESDKDELDAELLTTFLAVEAALVGVEHKPRIIVESAYPMAMHLLNTYHQTHFNPHNKIDEYEAAEEMVVRDANSYIEIPLYASGKIMSTSSLDAILCQTTYTPEVLDFLNCCLSMTPGDNLSVMNEMDDDQSSGILVQVDVEEDYYGKPYMRVFEGMLQEYGMIPIGLYRFDGYTGLPYVYTCPDPKHIIEETDKVFAIVSFPCNKDCSAFLEERSSCNWFSPKRSKSVPSSPRPGGN